MKFEIKQMDTNDMFITNIDLFGDKNLGNAMEEEINTLRNENQLLKSRNNRLLIQMARI